MLPWEGQVRIVPVPWPSVTTGLPLVSTDCSERVLVDVFSISPPTVKVSDHC